MSDQGETIHAAVQGLIRTTRLLERALDGLTLADFRILAAVDGGAERASRLADRLALGRPAISASVESLTRRGLLVREQEGADRRAARLALTGDGHRRFVEAQTALAAALDPVLARTGDPDGTAGTLAALGRAVDLLRADLAAAR